MPTMYPDYDAQIRNQGTSWSTIRDNKDGDAVDDTSTYNSQAVSTLVFTGRGSTTYRICRTLLNFNTSSITSTVESATLTISGATSYSNHEDFAIVKGNFLMAATTSNSAFQGIVGWNSTDVNNDSNVTHYSNAYFASSSWNINSGNTILLNATALSDIVSLSDFKIVLIDYVYDLRNVTPTASNQSVGMWYSEAASASLRPLLTINYPSTDNSIFFGANF